MISSETMTLLLIGYLAFSGVTAIIAGLTGMPKTQKYEIGHSIIGFIVVIIAIVLYMW